MTCRDCKLPLGVEQTLKADDVDTRIHQCACGSRWLSESRIVRRLQPAQIRGTGKVPLPDKGPASPLSSDGGFGGPLSEVSGQTQDSGPISPANPERGRARSNTEAIDYPGEFLLVWKQTGKRGAKLLAHKAWVKAGRPKWSAIEPAWLAYLLSERPMAGFVKDLSSWLNAKCHQQEWEPATVKPIRQLESFAVRAEREREERLLDERAESLFGTGANR